MDSDSDASPDLKKQPLNDVNPVNDAGDNAKAKSNVNSASEATVKKTAPKQSESVPSTPSNQSKYGNNSTDRDDTGITGIEVESSDQWSDGARSRENKESGQIEFRVDENRLILPRNRIEEDPLLIELEKNVDQYLLETE